MRRLVTTKFFLALQENVQKDTSIDNRELNGMYDEFAAFVFSESSNSKDRTTYHHALVFTLSVLAEMEKQIPQKNGTFLKQCNLVD